MPTELPTAGKLLQEAFAVSNVKAFETAALRLFRFQYRNNPVYQAYCNALKVKEQQVIMLCDIPFLPISFFKTHNVLTGEKSINDTIFESSGTTGQQTSRHMVADISVYKQSFRQTFLRFYGPAQAYCILALLPSYLERQQSSLVYMVTDLIRQSGHPQSGFYLYDVEQLASTLKKLQAAGQKTILFGVTYALLDFAEKYAMPLKDVTIIETGGMKGRKKEMVRAEVHGVLKKSFSLLAIHSEYGMTELLSQAYAQEEGRFQAPPWLKLFVREEDDPLTTRNGAGSGGLNIIDLANVFSCAFIAAEDAGKIYADGSFEVLGRLDNAEIRGCSLLAL